MIGLKDMAKSTISSKTKTVTALIAKPLTEGDNLVSCVGPWVSMQSAYLSGAAQSGLGVLSMLGLLCVSAPLLSCCSAETGLGLVGGSLRLCGARCTG